MVAAEGMPDEVFLKMLATALAELSVSEDQFLARLGKWPR